MKRPIPESRIKGLSLPPYGNNCAHITAFVKDEEFEFQVYSNVEAIALAGLRFKANYYRQACPGGLGYCAEHGRDVEEYIADCELYSIGIPTGLGTFEELVAFAKEKNAFLYIYRGEAHWDLLVFKAGVSEIQVYKVGPDCLPYKTKE